MTNIQNNTVTIAPFREHLLELRRRLFWCLLVLGLGSILGWLLHEPIIGVLRRPLKESLYITSPTGGLDFIISISLLVGLAISVPVIAYHALQFVKPVHKNMPLGKVLVFALASVTLALLGASFGYFVSLPSALHFLTNLGSEQLSPMINANDYLNFVMVYIISLAIIFQLPLVLLFINNVTPLKPSKLMGYQRYIIIASFIIAAIITPTPDPINQLIMALPMVIMYQLAVMCILIANRKANRKVIRPDQQKASQANKLEVPNEAQLKPSRPATVARFTPLLAQPVMAHQPRQVVHKISRSDTKVINLKEMKPNPKRKKSSSKLFHNANLPVRKFDIGPIA